jgi:hypothetical protein
MVRRILFTQREQKKTCVRERVREKGVGRKKNNLQHTIQNKSANRCQVSAEESKNAIDLPDMPDNIPGPCEMSVSGSAGRVKKVAGQSCTDYIKWRQQQ